VSLDLIVLIPDAASSFEQALSTYLSEDEEGDPSTPTLKAFANEIDARFGDDDWGPLRATRSTFTITCRW
jgi:hypothetical protein